MLDFRCYRCDVKLGDGLPPISALNPAQSSVAESFGIDASEAKLYQDVLRGTSFEGMSTGSFCEVCLLFIKEFPSAMEHDGEYFQEATMAALAVMTEEDQKAFKMGRRQYIRDHVYRSRMAKLLAAKAIYKSEEALPLLSFIEELIRNAQVQTEAERLRNLK